MKRFYHSELEQFRANLVLMGEKAIEVVRLSIRALLNQEIELCDEVLRMDDSIDDLEVAVDNEGIRYISLRSPVATELRLLTVGMKVGHELERVGDEACNIAKRSRKLIRQDPKADLNEIPRMSDLVIEMLRDSIDSFLNEDMERARTIPLRDREVDSLNRAIYASLTDRITQDTDSVKAQLNLIFISKALERIADHATNLAEEVVILCGGEDIRHSQHVKEAKRLDEDE